MKAKIILEKNESRDEAEELLIKALESHRTGSSHTEEFPDKAMEHIADILKGKHKDMFNEMLEDIFKLLDEEA